MKKELFAFLTVTLSLTGAMILAKENLEEQVREFGQRQETQRQERKQEQKEENRVFRKSLEGKTSPEQSEAIESQRGVRDRDNNKFDARILEQTKEFDRQQGVGVEHISRK